MHPRITSSRTATCWITACLTFAVIACGGDAAAPGGTGGASATSAAEGSTGSGETVTPVGTPGLVDVSEASTIAKLGVPFDANRKDLVGPDKHGAMYGRKPEVVPVVDGEALYVAWRDHTEEASAKTFLVRLEREGAAVHVAHAYELMSLGVLLGLAMGPDGHLYYATGSPDPDITVEDPPVGEYRSDIARLLKFDRAGEVVFDIDVDPARAKSSDKPEQVIAPGKASTGRLLVGGDEVMLIHGINTPPDENGTRHQKSLSTLFDRGSGEVVRTESLWVSHSFDQRLLHDAGGFIEFHLGDAYPRTVVFGRTTVDEVSSGYTLMHVKGETGANNTYTRLGNFVQSTSKAGGGLYDYLGLVATERTTETTLLEGAKKVAGARDLALVRVRRDFELMDKKDMPSYLDTSGLEPVALSSGGKDEANYLRWLTSYGAGKSVKHFAERPKLVKLAGGNVLVLWERWSYDVFDGTFGMVLDAAGEVLLKEKLVTDSHLPRGDDAIPWGKQAVWVTGDEDKGQLWLHLVNASLEYERFVVD